MSKLDRQLDEVYGENRVVIKWPDDDEVDIEAIRKYLRVEIDRHHQRVPLDLRAVNGAPEALVDLLLEAQVYARSHSKIISVSSALPPMQDALNGRRRRKGKSSRDRDTGAASALAQSVIERQLGNETPTYDISKAQKVERKKPKAKHRAKNNKQKRKYSRRDYLILAAVVLGVTGVIGAVECYLIFNQSDVVIPNKTFEGGIQDQGIQDQAVRVPAEPQVVIDGYRIWTDERTGFESNAKFVKVEEGTVHLIREDGRSLTVDLDTLSQADRDFIEQSMPRQ